MIGLALGMMIACMDGTIVGTCAAEIARDLGGMELYSWMITAYLLAETGMVPIAGKMSDRYGRKPLFISGLILFIGGSVVAGLSTSMTMLIICPLMLIIVATSSAFLVSQLNGLASRLPFSGV